MYLRRNHVKGCAVKKKRAGRGRTARVRVNLPEPPHGLAAQYEGQGHSEIRHAEEDIRKAHTSREVT
jgi:hypothetical protein